MENRFWTTKEVRELMFSSYNKRTEDSKPIPTKELNAWIDKQLKEKGEVKPLKGLVSFKDLSELDLKEFAEEWLKLQNEYTPSALRAGEVRIDRDEKWGIGIEDRKSGVGMLYGPCDFEKDCLESVGDEGWKIYHFLRNSDKFEIIWVWKEDKWVKFKNK
jgi:hypothetical protein